MRTIATGLLPRAAGAGRVALSLGRAAARCAVTRGAEVADDEALGEALVAELDRMKGLSMKVGQILSTLETGLPDATTEVLARLQRGAAPLDPEVIRAEIAAGLGRPVEESFDGFDDTPVAAASIGQVHRASLGGRALAVKVRYPGVRDTIASDFVALDRVAGLASLATAVDGRALTAELSARLLEECDFRREAAWLVAMRAHLGEDPALRVPDVIPERSCERVLTTGWVDGARFEGLRAAPAPEREAAAATLLRFVWGSLLGGGFLHADPHPGNFVFGTDGQVTVLDWGSVRRFTPGEVEPFRALVRVVTGGERTRFPDALSVAGLVPERARYDFDEGWEMFRWMWAPYLAPSFRFDPAWARAGARFSRPGAPNQRHQAFPPAWIWLFRVSFGVHAALSRLGVTADARAVLREALDRPLHPVPDPTVGLSE